ncbi:tRNA uridine-5-carboxymethylaminomethyl(34) synthesis GTPase MnmE [Azorhizobium doebereinerae]|uniref:tRNA uridine-5-carboxymethylaminomethyl(34) synthesis GTPase MnmE n=1 Tax=Azorhizobium doebereinerae TaxID=281091 RepID=UPI00040C997B|nr:tRNA uridine-5-carboxymethylaminomethyl(34) synthesis GTPase MnmE [Azorhizobium doebereinerae]
MTRSSDTIFALSSGRLPSGVALVRISGRAARQAALALAGAVPPARVARYAVLRHPETREVLDRGLVLFFPGPRSATGEDLVELHLHGGPAVVAVILRTLGDLPGFRPAAPGEFTRRAHAHGKMDLAEVEGLADLIAAESEAQRRQALAQSAGALSRAVAGWRERLIRALALVEATIDFADEGDVPDDLTGPARVEAARLRAEIAAVVADAARGERVRDGLVIAIAGPPNAGKSTLLNRLAGREAAIVSATPGTTRDVLEVHLDLAGQAVILVDTAGLRETDDAVEAEGVRRARARAGAADLVLWLSEDGAPPPPDLPGALAVWTKRDVGAGGAAPPVAARDQGHPGAPLPAPHSAGAARAPADGLGAGPGVGPADGPAKPSSGSPAGASAGVAPLAISARTGAGMDDLIAEIERRAARLGGGEPALVTRARQRHALAAALIELDAALAIGAGGEDLLAEHLRLSARALDTVVGRVDVEDVLDALFRTFCIGK